MSMPDEFKLPRPQDFCRNGFTNGKKHCFVGWQRELLPFPTIWVIATEDDRGDGRRFFAAALKVARRLKLKAKLIQGFPAATTCFDYNDDPRNTHEQLAKWFEETIKELGYDIS